MDTITKNVNTVYISKNEDVIEDLLCSIRKEMAAYCNSKILQDKVAECNEILEIVLTQNKWIEVSNKCFYYFETPKFRYLIPNTNKKPLNKLIPNYDLIFGHMCGGNYSVADELIESIEVEEISLGYMAAEDKNILFREGDNPIRGTLNSYIHYKFGSELRHFDKGDPDRTWSDHDCNGCILPIHKSAVSNKTAIAFFVENGLLLTDMTKGEKECFRELINLYKKGYIVTGEKIRLSDDFCKNLIEGKVTRLFDIDFSRKNVLGMIDGKDISEDINNKIIGKYLCCDKVRADIEPYDEGQLYEINRGHWELWSGNATNNMVTVKLNKNFVARNPIADVNQKGVVGIDFGTKSTVVVLLDDNSKIHQMRIGNGNLKKEVKKSDYENPTAMEFINIKHFMKMYHEYNGRPKTLWKDLTISHSAVSSLREAKNSENYYAFFSDLKQWADDSTRKIRIRDANQYEEVLDDFLDIKEESLNPIEIYAYYLGLAINNMRNGIYMDYILSYPVNYPVKVRNKIIESFERGIKKSLPQEVLDSKECMDLFRVQAGVSEPAAYAISALKGYGFYPKEGEKYFYGIFDFGGGTTDFDFGLWRGAEGKECRRSDYVIEHFGAGGDRYLGGENLLELLSFEVFKDNKKTMLENELTFFLPNECSVFSGSEMLLSTSQEARLNTKQLMEKLRCFWESGALINLDESGKLKTKTVNENPDIKSGLNAIMEGTIKVSLFDKNGTIHPNIELSVSANKLNQIITDRIRVGVINFFEAMKNIFDRPEVQDINKINIFLAGNSSKSPIVKQIFEEQIAERTKNIKDFFRERNQEIDVENWFELFYALGTPEAEEKQKELGIFEGNSLAEYEKPTGKTGVAYGLIEGRNGSRIKVISEIANTDETKFKFYIGYEKRGKFHVEIERDIDYKKWIEFIDASENDFELFYTSLPEATTNQMDITRVKRMPCRIKETYDADNINIYLQAVEPDTLEYVVGTLDEVQKGNYMEGPYRIKLQE